VTLYRLSQGELCILSASCILNSIGFDVSIDASQDSEVFKIGMSAFDEVMKKNIHVENFAYKGAAERFSDIMWAIEQLVFMRFDKRLAIFLLDEWRPPTKRSPRTWAAPAKWSRACSNPSRPRAWSSSGGVRSRSWTAKGSRN
jgi:hypothetical protein